MSNVADQSIINEYLPGQNISKQSAGFRVHVEVRACHSGK